MPLTRRMLTPKPLLAGAASVVQGHVPADRDAVNLETTGMSTCLMEFVCRFAVNLETTGKTFCLMEFVCRFAVVPQRRRRRHRHCRCRSTPNCDSVSLFRSPGSDL
jgi:hypothetical protein